MQKSSDVERAVVDDVKFGVVAVINKALAKTIASGTDPQMWPAEDKMKYLVILDVQDEILRRISQTFAASKGAPKK